MKKKPKKSTPLPTVSEAPTRKHCGFCVGAGYAYALYTRIVRVRDADGVYRIFEVLEHGKATVLLNGSASTAFVVRTAAAAHTALCELLPIEKEEAEGPQS